MREGDVMKDMSERTTVLLMLLMALIVVLMVFKLESSNQILSANDGQPYLVGQYKVGDDTVPHVHQVWCINGLFSKSAVDDSPFCYVEVIDDWEWEGVE